MRLSSLRNAVSGVLSGLDARVYAGLGVDNWHEVTDPEIPERADTGKAHLGFWVDIREARSVDPRSARIERPCVIRFLHRMRPKQKATDLDLADDASHAAWWALVSEPSALTGIGIEVSPDTSAWTVEPTDSSEWLLCEVRVLISYFDHEGV